MVGGKKKTGGPSRILVQKIKTVIETDKSLAPWDTNFLSDLCDLLIEQNINFDRDSRAVFKTKVENALKYLKDNQLINSSFFDEPMSSGESDVAEPGIKLMEYKDHNLLNNSLYSPKEPTTLTKKRTNTEIKTKQPLSKRPRTRTAPSDVATTTGGDMGFTFSLPKERYSDLGGVEELLADIRELIEWPLMHPEIYQHLGVAPPVGVLLHGPPGCGKTLLAQAIGGELGLPFYKISAPEIISGMSGESEAKLRSLFNAATATAPSVIFIDELDAIAPKRESVQREMEKRIVSQLISCMNEIASAAAEKGSVMVIGATNRPQTIDTALRRAGRFDREISLGVPDLPARERILRVLTSKLTISGEFDYNGLARLTPGFVGADLAALTKEAAVISIRRIFYHQLSAPAPSTPLPVPSPNSLLSSSVDTIDSPLPSPLITDNQHVEVHSLESRQTVSNRLRSSVKLEAEQLEKLFIIMDDFLKAVKRVQPSAKREGFATVPNVTWDQVGALEHIRDELNVTIVQPLKRTDKIFSHLGLTNPAGILLYGPPGCGKTLLAKAIANDANANFISVKGPELLNKFVGESERAVRNVFQRARSSAPCIVFFDELDALCPKRSGESSSSHSSERVVNQLLTEMDGLEERKNVYVIAATNRPDIIDPAMLRPGRFDKLLYVPLPSPLERKDILLTLSKKLPVSIDVDLHKVAVDERCSRFSGADLASLVREASFERLREYLKKEKDSKGNKEVFTNIMIEMKHFNAALNKIGPSVSQQDEKRYNRLQKKFSNFVQTDEVADSAKSKTEGSVEGKNEENTEDKMSEDKQ